MSWALVTADWCPAWKNNVASCLVIGAESELADRLQKAAGYHHEVNADSRLV